MANAWSAGTTQNWAEEVDAAEAQNGGPLGKPAPATTSYSHDQAFPSLAEASKPAAKKKPQKLALGEFMKSGGSARANEAELRSQLPTASRGKVPGDDREDGALGGAFKDYGGDRRGGGFGRRDEEGDDRRAPREPSRADMADDWGANRKYESGGPSGGGGGGGFGSGGYGERRGGGGGGGGFEDRGARRDAAPSAADAAGDWGASRKFEPSGDRGGGERRGGFGGGGGYEASERPARRPMFEDRPSRGDDEATWARGAAPGGGGDAGERGGGGGFGADRDRERGGRGYGFSGADSSAADSADRWQRRGGPADGAPPSAAAPTERPRLVLQPRTKPVAGEGAAAAAASGPAGTGAGAAAAASAGVSPASSEASADKPRRANPFGAARPREEVLREKGVDYKKQELRLEHGEVIRDKAPEEEELEKEVEEMRSRLEGLKAVEPGETDSLGALERELDAKETALYKLQAELDDRVRFSKGHRAEREGEGRGAPPPRSGGAPYEGARDRERAPPPADAREYDRQRGGQGDRSPAERGAGGARGGAGGGGGGGAPPRPGAERERAW